jgi:hypothetical protein
MSVDPAAPLVLQGSLELKAMSPSKMVPAG